jgi:predicted nucleotidyltransferase
MSLIHKMWPFAAGRRRHDIELENRIIHTVADGVTATGILLHGSRATGVADETSDFDVICILPAEAKQRREFLPFQNVYIDAYYSPVAPLYRRLHAVYPNNNNFPLNALTCGKILLDRTGQLTRLVETAAAMRAAGPKPLSDEERIFVRQQIASALSSVKRSLARAEHSASARGLTQVRCAEIFSKIIYTYCVERRQWTNSIPSVIRWAESAFPELYVKAQSYLTASDLEEAIAALQELLYFLGTVEQALPGSGDNRRNLSTIRRRT